MKNVKFFNKFLALVIALTMLVMPVNVNAATVQEKQALVTAFVTAVKAMSPDAKEGLVTTVETFLKADAKESMEQVVTDMFAQLLNGQKERINTYFEISNATVVIADLADYVASQEGDMSSDIANLRTHLDNSSLNSNFEAALNARDFGKQLSDAGLDQPKIADSIYKVAGLYDDLQTYKNLNNIGMGQIKIVQLNQTNNQMYISNDGMTQLIGAIEAVKKRNH